ncbi:hypothetical protein ACFZ81_09935 [Acinetobacter baumannii]
MDKCGDEFEQHFLSLPFSNSEAAQKCLDACDFDVKQNAFIPNAKWFNNNDVDEGVIYCCMLNTAYMSFLKQQAKVEELQKQLSEYIFVSETLDEMYVKEVQKSDELQKRVDELERKLQIKTRHCEFYEQSRNGHRSLAIHRKKQINSALEQIEKLYSKAENDYEKDRNPYYDGMLSALDLAEQAIRGELEEQALKDGEA